MALVEGCKHELEVTIPAAAFAEESEKVLASIQKKAHLQGFRPGKAPASLIRKKFSGDIEQETLEHLVPKFLDKACEKEGLKLVSRPSVKDLHHHDGGDVHFKAEFEVAPEFELQDYRGLKIEYAEPEVVDADVDGRLNEIRESRAQFVNVDPREAKDGDHVLVTLESISGVDEPVKQADINIEIGGKDTFQPFSDALRGSMPGDAREAEISYPEDYAARHLAGRTVKFRITPKALRLKELPELNDEFAKDLGDFQSLDEVREEIRKGIYREREYAAQTAAKNQLIEKLADGHEFPVPEVYIDRQVENNIESQLHSLQSQGVDISKLKLDWSQLRQSQAERAKKDVKASLLLEKISTAESIYATEEEMDAELQRISRSQREPVAAVRMKLEKDGSLGRIASRIRTEKTLNFLFEHAVKEAPVEAKAE